MHDLDDNILYKTRANPFAVISHFGVTDFPPMPSLNGLIRRKRTLRMEFWLRIMTVRGKNIRWCLLSGLPRCMFLALGG